MRQTGLWRVVALILAIATLLPACGSGRGRRTDADKPGKTTATQPAPPASGPGSTAYPHAAVTKTLHGEGALAYWLFEPASPAPRGAPVILFLHGWRAVDPRDYGGWIDHLARRGNIVIYPVSEGSRSDSADQILAAALANTKSAIERLRSGTGVRPDLDRFAIVGHSMGGGLTAQIAARAREAGLPTPKAIMPTQPGWRGSDTMPTDKLGGIPSSVLMLVVIGSQDQFASTRQDKTIWAATKHVPDTRKRYIVVQSDDHGAPPLVADHSSPLAYRSDYGTPPTAAQQRRIQLVERFTGMRENTANALNYWGYWRLFDALTEAAFAGKDVEAALGAARPLGRWSDGTPMKPWTETRTP